MEIKKNHLVQHLLWLLNNYVFCYEGKSPFTVQKLYLKKNNNFYNIKKNKKITKKLTHMICMIWYERRWVLPIIIGYYRLLPEEEPWRHEKAFIYKPQISALKTALQKEKQTIGNIYNSLSEFYEVHLI